MSSASAGNGFSSAITGDAASTLNISSTVSFSATGSQQLANFNGTVEIASGNQLRFSSTSGPGGNGGANTSFNVNGSITARNGTSGGSSIILGALTGSGQLQGPATAAQTVIYQVGDKGTSTTFTGTIVNGTGSAALTKTGAGTLTLTGTSTYTGPTRINAGILSVSSIGNGGVAGNIGQATNASGNLVLNGGTLQYTGATASSDRGMTLNNVAGNKIDVSTAATTLTDSGVLAGAGGFQKTGAGTLALSGTSTYTGATSVSAGTLLVNGALGNTPTSVATGAVLGGDGTIGGNVTVDGTLSVGTDTAVGTIGTLDITGATGLTLGASGVYEAGITGAGTFDTLNITNAFAAGGTIKPVLSGYAPVLGDIFNIADFGSFSGSPTFDYSSAVLGAGLTWDDSYFATDGTLRIIAVVPESSTAIFSGLGALALLRRRRA